MLHGCDPSWVDASEGPRGKRAAPEDDPLDRILIYPTVAPQKPRRDKRLRENGQKTVLDGQSLDLVPRATRHLACLTEKRRVARDACCD